MRDGKPGLARAGRSGTEYQCVALESAHVGILARRARAHRAFAQVDLFEGGPRGRRIEIEQRTLCDHQPDRTLDVALRNIVAALDLLIQSLKDAARALAGIARAFERYPVAARVRH